MKKTSKFGLFLLLGGSLAGAYALTPDELKPNFLVRTKPVIYSRLEGAKWVEQCTKRYPETLLLAQSAVRKTEENQASLKGSYSEQLFGHKYVEFDRTIMTLYCLKFILDGSDQAYERFTAGQSAAVKLSPESFKKLHRQGKALLESKRAGLSPLKMAEAMETALVLGDIGKSEKARELFKDYKITAPDHDDFYGEAIKVIDQYPEICPSFARLSQAARQLLVKTANIAHFGHITHLEGGVEMFKGLKESQIARLDPAALSFDLFVHTCDVAGALGHVNNQSSLVYTETTHKAMQAMMRAVQGLSDPSKSTCDAYRDYVKVRALWLGLNADHSDERVLARIGAMMRLFTPEEGAVIRHAMSALGDDVRAKIAAELDVRPQDEEGRTPTYIPAVLVNLSNNPALGLTPQERLAKAMTIGLPFVADVLSAHKKMVANGEIDPAIPLNFNPIAAIAKSAPETLATHKFSIDSEGAVH